MPELGLYAIRLGLLTAMAGIGAGLYAGVAQRADWGRVAERSVYLVFGFLGVAMFALFWSLAHNDFSLAYVAQHSASTMTLPYRLAALWGGQSGSLLLWLWILTAYGSAAVFAHRHRHRNLMPWVCVVLLSNALFFLVLTNFVTNPFERLPHTEVFSDGNGLNPLLQHPMMTIHPLMLYTGFVGFAVPFSFALAAMITGESMICDNKVAPPTHPRPSGPRSSCASSSST